MAANQSRRRRGLTEKQVRFVEEYLKDLNATQAYIRAGYQARGNSAEANGNRLIRNDQVRAAVDAAMMARSERTGVTVDGVLTELEPLAHSCIDHYAIDDAGNAKLAPGAPSNAMRAVRSNQAPHLVRQARQRHRADRGAQPLGQGKGARTRGLAFGHVEAAARCEWSACADLLAPSRRDSGSWELVPERGLMSGTHCLPWHCRRGER